MTDRSMTLEDLQHSDAAITTDVTLRNYRTILNKINDHYGWDQDVIYYDRLEEHSKELPDVMKEIWNVTSIAMLKQKLSGISSLMTRTRFGSKHKVKAVIRTADRLQNIQVQRALQPVPDWETVVLPKLKEASVNNDVCGIIARIFSYGYVLRVGEIFTTRLIDDGISNFLDLDNHKWIVRNQKNRKVKEFEVDADLCKSIPRGMWLLRKSDGQPYSRCCRNLGYHDWSLPSNNTIRKSYETWNFNKSKRDEEERNAWHNILGHCPEVAEDYYNHPEEVEKPIKVKPKIVKKEKVKIKVRPKQKTECDHVLNVTNSMDGSVFKECIKCSYSSFHMPAKK